MSNYLKGYTGYQKRVIKGVAELLEERPFSYKKKNNNHLEIKVKGIDRVFYTSATPSDHRGYENFLSDIKIELRKLTESDVVPSNVIEPINTTQADDRQASLDKITRTIIKRIRMSIDKIQQDEHRAVISDTAPNDEIIRDFREALVTREIDLAMKSKDDKDYYPVAMLKQRKITIRDNLDFMLPSTAYYHDELKEKLDQARSELRESSPNTTKNNEQGKKENVIEPVKQNEPVDREETGMDLQQLAKAKRNKRISEIKKLTKGQITLLMNDFEEALGQKHEEDIQDLVAQIKEKGITLEEIQERLA